MMDVSQLRQGMILKIDSEDHNQFHVVSAHIVSGKFGPYVETKYQDSHALLVASQDCEIVRDGAKHIEFYQLKPINAKKHSPENWDATNRRFAELVIMDEQGSAWKTDATMLLAIKTKDFNVKVGEYSNKTSELSQQSTNTFLNWSTAYRVRQPFPHNFNESFKKALEDSGSEKKLLALVDDVRALHVWVDKDDEHANHYHALMTAVVYESKDISSALRVMENLSAHIKEYHPDITLLSGTEDIPDYIELPEHATADLAVNDEDFNFAMANNMRAYYLEYICNQAELTAQMISEALESN